MTSSKRVIGMVDPVRPEASPDSLRERILRLVLRAGLVVGFIAAIPGVALSLREGLWHVAVADAVVYAWVVVIFVARGWSLRIRIFQFLALVYALSVFLLIAVGPVGAGSVFLLGFSVLAALFWGLPAARITLVLNAVTLIGVTIFDQTLKPVWLTGPGPVPLLLWMVLDTSFLAVNAVLSFSLAAFLRDLEDEVARRRQAELASQRLARAVEHTRELVLISDAEGRVEYVNPAFTAATGFEADKAKGRLLSDVGVLAARSDDVRAIWRGLQQGEPWTGELRNQRKDGTSYDADVSLSPVRVDSGRVQHVVAVLRDITHERELDRHLQRAQKLEAIGTLAAGIAHDFNNILVPIMANAEFVRDNLARDNPGRADLEEVLRAGERAAALVRRILTFSRQVRTERGPLAVAPLLNETTKLLRASLPATIEVRVELEARQARAVAEPSEMQQVIMNLCTNAAQAMAEHGGVLRVGLREVGEVALPVPRPLGLAVASSYLVITVDDTGCGIPPANLDRIFDPFFTTKAPGEGTGLGLAMVHATVASLGGAISVSSVVGKGTRFEVFVPAAGAKVELDEQRLLPVPHAKGERVLVVDDEPAVREVCRRLLSGWGFDALVAASADDALGVLAETRPPPVAMLTDLTMPRMSGIELAIASRRYVPDLPVVVMSGQIGREVEARLAEAGIEGVIAKPFSPTQLGQVLARVLERRAAAVASGATGR
jgi:PAS domain S-box-containing protein